MRVSRFKKAVKLENKIIGWLHGGVFYKSVIGAKHRLRYPPAWAIQADVFDEQVKPFATEIVIWDKESDIKYRTSVKHFDEHKDILDRGYGEQYCLLLEDWEIERS